ncbi:hypothetical protein [Micromonospora coxensis]|uniref:hypothetical protein n=1 Tax=Micromonospora coxensis TaxID=356852 RepID=UPI003437DB76
MGLPNEAKAEVSRLLASIRDSLSQIDRILGLEAPTASPTGSNLASTAGGCDEFEIIDHEPIREFTYRWPGGKSNYLDAVKYTVRHGDAEDVFAIGAEEGGRSSYQRADRGRIVVFHRRGTSPMSYYPLVEFAESDLEPDLYAAIVPQPTAPRKGSIAADLDELREVPHLRNAKLERADTVFHSVQSGPSLRLLVTRDDARMMIEHARWVDRLRRTNP